MSNPSSLPHALHNEEVCNYINASGKYNDWVVNTAFYSALHFVHDKTFPLNHAFAGKTSTAYDKFEDYYADLVLTIASSKHKATIYLVRKFLKPLSSDYKRLYDLCMDARYNNFVVPDATAQLAVKLLAKIKAACMSTTVTVSGSTSAKPVVS
jgi:hypothetical protein